MEGLRQPLEDGIITVSRVADTVTFPAECILIAAMNPCPCGFKGLPEARCVGVGACERYGARISGPLRDRIDLHIEVPRLKPDELVGAQDGECSEVIRERVIKARERQAARIGSHKVNAKMTPKEMRELIVLDEESKEFMRLVSAKIGLSARVFDRILKVGRTISDLAGLDKVTKTQLAEAIQYRDRQDAVH
jgi:magnesium chelatase family protein